MSGSMMLTNTMSTVKFCGITALLGVFLKTNKHQNLTRFRHPIQDHGSQLDRPSACQQHSPRIRGPAFQLNVACSPRKVRFTALERCFWNFRAISNFLLLRMPPVDLCVIQEEPTHKYRNNQMKPFNGSGKSTSLQHQIMKIL